MLVPQRTVPVNLGLNLFGGQLGSSRTAAVVLVSWRSNGTVHLQKIRSLSKGYSSLSDLRPVVVTHRLGLDDTLVTHIDANRIEHIVGDGVDDILHQLFDRHDRFDAGLDRGRGSFRRALLKQHRTNEQQPGAGEKTSTVSAHVTPSCEDAISGSYPQARGRVPEEFLKLESESPGSSSHCF